MHACVCVRACVYVCVCVCVSECVYDRYHVKPLIPNTGHEEGGGERKSRVHGDCIASD